MKPRRCVFWVDDDTYGKGVHLVVGEAGIQKINKLSEKFGCDKISPGSLIGAYFTQYDKSGVCHNTVLVKTYRNSPAEMSVLAHEVLHHTFETMKKCGVEQGENSEAYTYYFEAMLYKCLKALKTVHTMSRR